MDAERFIEKAETALRRRNPAQAIALYRQVLRADPGHAGARTGLLRSYHRKAELKGGASLLDRTAAKGMVGAAKGLATARKSAAVVKTCDTGLERNPHDVSLASLLAAALEAQEHAEAALATWEFLLELDADDTAALKGAGRLHYRMRSIERAVECFERAHAVDPHDPEVERMRKTLAAEGTLASTRFETATSSRELIKDPSAMRQQQRTERRHRTEDERAEDIESLTAALEADPKDRAVRLRLVDALAAAGDHARAAVRLDEGLEQNAADGELLDRRGEVRQAGLEAALAAARAAGDKAAVARLTTERAEQMVEEGRRRLGRDPGLGSVRLALARALYRLKRTDEAIEQFQALADDHRFQLDAQQGLGACFSRKGLFPLAARQFEAALAGAGGVRTDRGKEICYHLGLVCERMGDTSGALSRFLAVYEVDINYKDVATKVEALQG